MSVDQDKLQYYAAEIFAHLAAEAGPNWWDWEPIANKAFEAAEAFSRVADVRRASSGVQAAVAMTAEATVVRVPDVPTNAPEGVTPTTLSR
jgi:hypothetical protein